MEKKGKKKIVKDKVDVSSHDDDLCWWFVHKGIESSFLSIAVFGLLVRVAMSVHPYSGAGTPPEFGDYEAQRHWMEITLNLPVKEWYHNSTSNDLSYWGLDYPPLTAYQSYVHGVFLRYFEPGSVSLFTSRGYESYLGKLLMRWTVLSSDALIFFPAIFYFILVYYRNCSSGRKSDVAWHIAIVLINPCLILIDHGHFQYNCISLGLTLGAVAAVLSQKNLVAAVLFCLSLNHKQVLFRLAPFERGIYEDYVANFWCTTSIVIKWKRLFTTQSLKLLSLIVTILTCLPSMVQQIMAPSKRGFLYGLLNSSFSFYLFSFQVHEKSILLPLLPASLLAVELRGPFGLLMHYALFSMFPLLCRDQLIAPYIALYALFFLIYFTPGGRRDAKIHHSTMPTSLSLILAFFYLCSLVLHIIYLTIRPPEKYPFLFEAMIMLLCFSHFVVFVFYTNSRQWMLSRQDKEKKLN
ncbi:probable dolichyl pyrophosphate Man9GlcNAc2 alpha-1,3-glucosyltransferase isoform X4 [Jatropha curcas]|uniref:probable dolichyl pyrophosphate Man9GlcNAc2 alpha-1,3-glucosyltransferase isoform X4 n=1 Tax=Jatropha curcas TaxID=180498 RepID=UPI0005FAB299|nr:probable dolichyl pyrophosphate Man9GlcNAc2 alpha-1,3-glucosyltransferase isoform X4 [Jatropha curcas]